MSAHRGRPAGNQSAAVELRVLDPGGQHPAFTWQVLGGHGHLLAAGQVAGAPNTPELAGWRYHAFTDAAKAAITALQELEAAQRQPAAGHNHRDADPGRHARTCDFCAAAPATWRYPTRGSQLTTVQVGGMGDVLGDLAALGYDARWDCLSAADVGAPHLRRRVFVLAHPAGAGLADPNGLSIEEPHRQAEAGQPPSRRADAAGRGQAVADAHGGGRRADLGRVSAWEPDACRGGPLANPQGQRGAFRPPEGAGPWRPPGSGAVADADGSQPQRRGGSGELAAAPSSGADQGPQRQRDRHAAGGRGAAVADPDSGGWLGQGRLDQGPWAPLQPARPHRPSPGGRDVDGAEPGVGGGADGLPAGVDRPADPGRWPAPPGQAPQPWEPPRTIAGRHPGRTARLSRLGNAVVPQVGQVVGRWALATLHQLEAPAGGNQAQRRWPA